MFDQLQIYDARERRVVAMADAMLAAALAPARLFGRRAVGTPPASILVLRLERIGDLLMSMPALARLRELAPHARIDLAVGSWNQPLAQCIPGIDRIKVVDAPWLARGAAASWSVVVRQARAWKHAAYDLAINFEGDIRSHALMWLSGAPTRVGFDMAGGGPFLTMKQAYDPARHVGDNLLRLVETAFGVPPGTFPLVGERLRVPDEARQRAGELLDEGDARSMLVGIHVGGGRAIKQWDPARFGELAARLATAYPVRFVFTGSPEDRDLVQPALGQVPPHVPALTVTGQADLLTLAAVIERCAVFITGDTGPMHLAAAVGTPLVAIFGPSDPGRWGPLACRPEGRSPQRQTDAAHQQQESEAAAPWRVAIVHGDVACRPCNRIRKPPARCVGHTPDCLSAVTVGDVFAPVAAMLESLEATRRGR